MYLKNAFATYQGNPKYNVFVNKAIKILIQEQKCWTYECCVVEVHLAFCHMSNLQRKKQAFVIYNKN